MPFNRPTLTELIERQQADIESRLPGSDPRLRRTLLNALARSMSGVTHGLYGNLEWLAKQIIPDTADAEYLARHASWWGVSRKAATRATGSIIITGTDNTIVPAGTTWQRSDAVEFTSDVDATITTGTATVSITAVIEGKNANTAANSPLTIVSPIAGLDSTATVDTIGLSGGTDAEADDQLRSRLRDYVRRTPQGGADDDYLIWAAQVSGVTRAWVYRHELGLGTVTIRFMMDDTYVDGIPLAADVATLQTHIDALRPVTADVTVVAPVAVPINPTIKLSPLTTSVKTAVQTELADLLHRGAVPGGTILLSHLNEAISRAAGETNHVIVAPSSDVTHTVSQIAILGTITWQAIP